MHKNGGSRDACYKTLEKNFKYKPDKKKSPHACSS